jgi:hypothetical protein
MPFFVRLICWTDGAFQNSQEVAVIKQSLFDGRWYFHLRPDISQILIFDFVMHGGGNGCQCCSS